ncbi:tripartite tricarboxylate transporter TctB family protein [Devosia sp. MC532]|jgi:hypothetical protein|uniref:tripartite tricarboxylate transporter TctB family protein n=1 Tax=Devosia sp. MC532 TaxID=2799788 RepID=UPI0018F5A4DD|nr:tripartite tricarboxylate transporter TctB family protein [Devosia sp. MC532]MBJ7578238.1 tripartite tricarboxylate transporter TctB family protein [Devosia sp. MC532]
MTIKKDVLAGLVFMAIAVTFIALSASSLKFGSATRMGPGMFPTLVAGCLGVLGLVIFVLGVVRDGANLGKLPWRGLIAIMATPIVFGLTVRGLGLIGSLLLTIVVAGLASPQLGLKKIATIAVVLTAFCVGVFHYGLGVSIPLVGAWLRF